MCGYVIEVALKARICKTLRWANGFPQTSGEFKDLGSFKTHSFETLLRLSGRDHVRTANLADWSAVAAWNPESRYQPPGSVSQTDAQSIIAATRRLLRVL